MALTISECLCKEIRNIFNRWHSCTAYNLMDILIEKKQLNEHSIKFLVDVLYDGFFKSVWICAGERFNFRAILQENECWHA